MAVNSYIGSCESLYLQSHECMVCVYLWNCLPMLLHWHLFINKYYHLVLFNLMLDVTQADSCQILWSMAKALSEFSKLKVQYRGSACVTVVLLATN